MMGMDWKRFKSGSDIRGVALENDRGEPVDLTPAAVEQMARAFACWLSDKTGRPADTLTVALGRDSRLSGPRLAEDVIRGLTACGVSVKNCGMASTPAMFMTTVDLGVDGAVQITASHHPYHRNGLKFFLPSGGLEGSDIAALLTLCEGDLPTASTVGTVEQVDYMSTYCARLRDLIKQEVNAADYEHPLAGYRIAVDAGNGAGGFYATDVLAPLGADVSGSRYLEPDGRFPHHIPNPENAAAMASICEATLAANAHLGVIFDTDVDRAGCVGADGKEINRNRLVALAATIALEGHEDAWVVTDSITSDGLKTFIEQTLGGHHRRFKRGYRNVINEAQRLCAEGKDAPLAIETSGHAALQDNYFLDDGAYLMTRIIIKLAQGFPPEALIASLSEPAEAQEMRYAITEPQFQAYGLRVLDELEAYAAAQGWAVADDSCEGVRIAFPPHEGDGWALLRLSVHDPVMPLNVESNREGGCAVIMKQLLPFIEKQTALKRG
ncbi:MAG: phosphomannomutase/phosphoglucomutase [Clostridia bacterium]|nr:phosphomannomutase/phosphoglucomutase [Clostridia bacterium]